MSLLGYFLKHGNNDLNEKIKSTSFKDVNISIETFLFLIFIYFVYYIIMILILQDLNMGWELILIFLSLESCFKNNIIIEIKNLKNIIKFMKEKEEIN